MATDAQILDLRLMIGEPQSVLPYTDAALGAKIDAAGEDLNFAAYGIWTEKAAAAAELVNVSEAGSSRNMGDLQKNALNMAKHFAGMVSGGVAGDAPKATRLHKLQR